MKGFGSVGSNTRRDFETMPVLKSNTRLFFHCIFNIVHLLMLGNGSIHKRLAIDMKQLWTITKISHM